MDKFDQPIPDRFADSEDSFVITDAEGHVLWVNAAFTRLCGYEFSELKGSKPGAILQGPDTDPEVIEGMHQAINAGIGCVAELVNYHKDGHPYTVHIQIKPVRKSNGCITFFAAVEREFSPQEIGAIGRETLELALHKILEEFVEVLKKD